MALCIESAWDCNGVFVFGFLIAYCLSMQSTKKSQDNVLCALNAPLAKAQTNADSFRLGGSQDLRSYRASCTQSCSRKKCMQVMVSGKSKKGAEELPMKNFFDPILMD